MENLFEIVSSFRTAIEEAVNAGEIHEMATFPRGCCSFASDLLQRYLIEYNNFFTWYMSGQYGFGWNAESHAWLETQDGIVIDITGDQYKCKIWCLRNEFMLDREKMAFMINLSWINRLRIQDLKIL